MKEINLLEELEKIRFRYHLDLGAQVTDGNWWWIDIFHMGDGNWCISLRLQTEFREFTKTHNINIKNKSLLKALQEAVEKAKTTNEEILSTHQSKDK